MGAILHRGVDPRAQAEHAHARTAGRDIRSEPARRLDVWPQVARRAPGVVEAGALRDPDVPSARRAKTTWAIRSGAETQVVW